MSFDPATWLYDVISSAVFGVKKTIRDDEKEWERRTEAELEAEVHALDRKWRELESKIQPDLSEADEDFDAWSYFMTISKAARIKDWTREGVFYLTVRYQHVLWAAELPFVAAAIEEDAEARDSLELTKKRIEELQGNPGFAQSMAAATAAFRDERAVWKREQLEARAQQRAEAAAKEAAEAAKKLAPVPPKAEPAAPAAAEEGAAAHRGHRTPAHSFRTARPPALDREVVGVDEEEGDGAPRSPPPIAPARATPAAAADHASARSRGGARGGAGAMPEAPLPPPTAAGAGVGVEAGAAASTTAAKKGSKRGKSATFSFAEAGSLAGSEISAELPVRAARKASGKS